MVEAIRLVVWDLDETFWGGTLTEGGIVYSQFNHEVVIALARRGIMSTICSKNDFDQVRNLLTERGLWDYFVFPSISWEPKGPRLQHLIETVQLRPSTVMFIDDNHLNRQEAEFFVPELQVADETIIPEMLDNLLFKGKDDYKLTRLAQYKLLERRKQDEQSFVSDNTAFLRSCEIVVEIEHNVEAHLDRAIELINRTNQLNFTKARLPEQAEQAREQLDRYLKNYLVKAGLVRVRDRYGDYGFCGFYAITGKTIEHFCFSCRILNMHVETWLYRELGRPELTVRGEVLSNVFDATYKIDWIARQTTSNTAGGIAQLNPYKFSSMLVRGGCDMDAVVHYLSPLAATKITTVGSNRHGIDVRVDHSLLLRYAVEGSPPQAAATLKSLGVLPNEVEPPPKSDHKLWLLSFWADAQVPLYRHKVTQAVAPFHVHEFISQDISAVPPETFRQTVANSAYWPFHDEICANYEFVGLIGESEFKSNLGMILDAVAPSDQVVLLLLNDYRRSPDGSETYIAQRVRLVNRWLIELAPLYSNVRVLRIRDFVRQETEVHTFNHFDRMVYVRLAEHILGVEYGSTSDVAA